MCPLSPRHPFLLRRSPFHHLNLSSAHVHLRQPCQPVRDRVSRKLFASLWVSKPILLRSTFIRHDSYFGEKRQGGVAEKEIVQNEGMRKSISAMLLTEDDGFLDELVSAVARIGLEDLAPEGHQDIAIATPDVSAHGIQELPPNLSSHLKSRTRHRRRFPARPWSMSPPWHFKHNSPHSQPNSLSLKSTTRSSRPKSRNTSLHPAVQVGRKPYSKPN